MDKPILVTGGLGFIGSAFVRRMAALGNRVVNVDSFTYAASPDRIAGSPGPLVRTVKCDITAAEFHDVVVEHSPRLVIHFAAESHVTRSEKAADVFMRTNIEGTRAVMEAAREAEVPRVVHISTDEVYGPCPRGAFTEEEKEPGPGRATSAYARSKAMADDVARGFIDLIPLTIVRPTNCFGPWQHPEKAIARWITRALLGRRLPVWGDGLQLREWMHVDDAVDGIALLTERGQTGEVYNLGPGTPERTNVDVARTIARIAGAGDDLVYLTAYDRPQHDRRYAVDSTKIRALGWSPERELDAGLAETVEWYRQHRGWWEPLITAAEELYEDEESAAR